MNQATLELPVHAGSAPQVDDPRGFQIGWDHAHRGLAPPHAMLLAATPLRQGWLAGKAVFGRRTLSATRLCRAWLALRTRAWQEGAAFDDLHVTPHYLGQLQVDRCPVTRSLLGGVSASDAAPVIERINPRADYAPGNLVMLSARAARARAGNEIEALLRNAQRARLEGVDFDGLAAAAWSRLAALQAMATPLAFHDAARVALTLLAPPQIRPVNAAQGLQTLLTLQFAAGGWSQRTRAVCALLDDATLRQDFNLFVGTMAARVIERRAQQGPLREDLEDAWTDARVQRRWQHWVLSLGEAATARLLERASALPVSAIGMRARAAERASPHCAHPSARGADARTAHARGTRHLADRITASTPRAPTVAAPAIAS